MVKSSNLAFIVLLSLFSAPASAREGAMDALIGACAAPAPVFEAGPSAVPARAEGGISLQDITSQSTSGYEVFSAYPGLYRAIPSMENLRILKVFRYTDARGEERRLEVYYTGGDWMRYGLVYFGINSGGGSDKADAYFIADLSTADREGGAVPPAVNPFKDRELADFITARFLDREGGVVPGFASVASSMPSAKSSR
ncbi:MAG TPA: hypothetical protein PL037_06510 [Elusimicrobiales bacterium]|nr:hypothetical protein [Elusimicrobiales bacterium]